MMKINDLKVEKREPNSSLKLKKKSNGNQSIKENVPSTPNVSTVSSEDEAVTKVSNIKMTPKVLTVSKSNVIDVQYSRNRNSFNVYGKKKFAETYNLL